MKTKTKKGVIFATTVAFLQGFEGLIFNLFALAFAVGVMNTPEFAAASLGLKETLTLVVTIIVMGPKVVKGVFSKIKSKQGMYFLMAGSIGTAFGNFFYILGIALAGSGYGVILTAFYPIFSMVLMKFYNKEKENKLVWLGMIISVISGLLFVFIPVMIKGENFDVNILIGMLMGLLAALFWAIEGLFIKKGMELKNGIKFTNSEIVLSRSGSSLITTMIVIMPLMMVFGNTFSLYGQILTNWKAMLVTIIMVANLIALRFVHIYAISLIGPKLTAIIDSNNFLVPAIFVEFLRYIPGVAGKQFEDGMVQWWAFILMIPIAIGVFMVIYFREKKQIVMDKPIE